MTDISDEQLMVAFQEGNPHAFELLFEKYRIPLFNFIYRMLSARREEAEDLLQEIFLKVIRARELYEPRARFSTWLFAITRNHCLNFLRSRRYLRQEHSVSSDDCCDEFESTAAETVSGNAGPAEQMEEKEFLELIECAIHRLPDSLREVFLLHSVEGFEHKEVAEILRMNPATVRTNYRRARIALRRTLAHRLRREGIET